MATKKQVTTTATIGVVENVNVVENTVSDVQQQSPNENTNAGARTKNLYVKVDTFGAKDGKTVGTRIVDMYHFGTRNWLQNHHWWAMHNGHTVETQVASDDEITGYLAEQKLALAAKFNVERQHVAA